MRHHLVRFWCIDEVEHVQDHEKRKLLVGLERMPRFESRRKSGMG